MERNKTSCVFLVQCIYAETPDVCSSPTSYWPGCLAEVWRLVWEWDMETYVSSHLSIHIKNLRPFLPKDKSDGEADICISVFCFLVSLETAPKWSFSSHSI